MTSLLEQQKPFFSEVYLMGRGNFDPKDFGIEGVSKVDFIDSMVNFFNDTYKGGWTIDELLLHPREAVRFCDDVRRNYGYFDAPDDIILRVILNRRKNPNQ